MHNLSTLASSNDQVTKSGDNYSVTADLTISEDGAIASGETLTINIGVTLTIPGGLTLTIDSGGTLTTAASGLNVGIIENDGTITCSGTITPGASFTGSSSGLVSFASVAAYDLSVSSGNRLGTSLTANTAIANYMGAGTTKVILSGSETLTTSTYTLTIPASVTLEVGSGRTLTSTAGVVVNAGTIISSGTITSASDFTGSTGLVRFPTIAAYNNSNTSLTLSSNDMTSNFTLANVMSAGTIEVVLDDNLTTNGNNLTIPSGITLEIAASVTLTKSANDEVVNGGTINVLDTATIADTGTWTGSNGLVSFASVAAYDASVASGQLSTALTANTAIANYMGVGTTKVILSGSETLTTSTYTLTIPASVTLEVDSDGLTINGTITNNGTLTNNGIIYIGYGKYLPAGTLNNNNLVLYKDQWGGNGLRTSQTLNNDFNIASDGVLVIDSADVTLTIVNGVTLTNDGLFLISGELSIQTGGELINNIGGNGDRTEVSSFPVGKITNSGTITNTGGSGGNGIRNYSIITNNSGGTITNSNTGVGVGILLSGSSSIFTNSGTIDNTSSGTAMRLQNESTLGNESSGTINNNAVNGIIVITGNSSLKNKFNGTITNITNITKSDGGKYIQLADVDVKISSVDVTEGRTIANGEEFFSPDFKDVEVDDEVEKRRLLASAVSSILSSATNNTLLLISIKALKKILPKTFTTTATKMEVVTGDLVIPTSTSKIDTAYYIPTTLNEPLKITTKSGKILVVTQTSTTAFKINKYVNEAAYSGTTNPNGNSIERVSGYKERYDGFEFILGSITGRNVATRKRTRINASQPVTGFNLNSEVKMDQGSYSVSSLLSNYSQQYNFSYEDFSSSSGSSSSGYPQSSSLVSGSSSFSINSTSVLGVISTRLDINSTALSYNLILDSNQSINIEISSSSGSKLQLLNDANIIISKGSSSSTYFNSISKTHPISQIYLNIVINNTLSIRDKINQVEGLINYYSNNIQVMLFIERMLGRYLVYRPIGYLPSTTIYSREIVNEEKIDDINSAKTEEATLVPLSNNIKNKMYKNYLAQSK